MKKILLLTLLPFSIGCAKQEPIVTPLAESMYHSPLIVEHVALDHPYDLNLSLTTKSKNEHNLTASMELHGGSFYVSPFATGDFLGKFTVKLDDNNYVKLGDDIIETPRSKEVFDPHPFVNGKVNWVQENTSYHYPVILKTTEDFKVSGWIRFTIEPKCTFEEIPFDIINEAGQLRIQQYPKLDKRTCGTTNRPEE